MQIGNDNAGFARLLTAIAEVVPRPQVAVSIEGSRSYGIGLARALTAAGLLVIECEQPLACSAGDELQPWPPVTLWLSCAGTSGSGGW